MKQVFKKSLSWILMLALLFSAVPISHADTAHAGGALKREQSSAKDQGMESGEEAAPNADLSAEDSGQKPDASEQDGKSASEQNPAEAQKNVEAEKNEKQEAGDLESASKDAAEQTPELQTPEEQSPDLDAEIVQNAGEIDVSDVAEDQESLFQLFDSNQTELLFKKEAKKVSDNLWDVTLTIEGKDVKTTTDIVLLIDKATDKKLSAMKSSLNQAKDAAKTFVEKMIPNSGNSLSRIAVVSYAGSASTEIDLTSNKEDLKSAIDKIKGDKGAHLQAGIHEAKKILKEKSNADKKVIVLLSGARPDRSFYLNLKNDPSLYIKYREEKPWRGPTDYALGTDLPYEYVDTSQNLEMMSQVAAFCGFYIQPKGNNSYSDGNNYYLNFWNMAIVEAKDAKKSGCEIYAVGLPFERDKVYYDSERNVIRYMMNIAPGRYYHAVDADKLDGIYQKIAARLHPARDAVVTDSVGEMFEIASEVVEVKDKNDNSPEGLELKSTDGAITADLGTVKAELLPITIKYQVSPKEEALPGKTYPIGTESDVLKYVDRNSKNVELKASSPKVILSGASIRVYNLLVDEGGNLLKAVSDYDQKASGKDDSPIEIKFVLEEGKNKLKLNQKYKYEPKPEIVAGGKTFVLCGDFDSVKGTDGNSLGVQKGAFEKMFGESGSVDVHYAYKLKKPEAPGNNQGGNSGGSSSGGSSGGSSGSGSNVGVVKDPKEELTTVEEDTTPLGKLNSVDHFAYINGFPDGSIRPHGYLTREEVAAVFFRILDKDYREEIRSEVSNFMDVSAKRWSSKHIATLAKGEILNGYQDGSFQPNRRITRAELATIASRFDHLEENLEHSFTDMKGHWAEKYIASAAKKGWVNGYEDGTFKPNEYVTRAEFISFVNNVLNRHVKQEDILDGSVDFIDLQDSTVWYYCPIKAATNSYLYQELEDSEHPLLKFQKWTELIHPIIEM